jgi:hypothetical protein
MKKTGKRGFGIAMLLLSGVAVFFAACGKEDLEGAKRTIRVNFTIEDISYGDNEVVTRSGKAWAQETVATSLGDDIYMYATLAEAEAASLRAENIPIGNRLQIVAYKKTGGDSYTYEGDAKYVVTAGGIEPVPEHPVGLLLSSYGTYKFTAYSLNTSAVPDYSATAVAYSPNTAGTDPLWGETADISINSDDNDLTITVKHVYSKVKVSVTTAGISDPAPDISSPLDAAFLGYEASLKSGNFIKGTAENQTFTFPSFTTTTAIESGERMVYAGGEAVTSVKMTSVTIDGVTYVGPVARFNMRLESGKYYTLMIDFKMIIWAGSNIYWDGGKLTFEAPNADVHADEQRYQGLFFKWGSLVGISGTGVENRKFSETTKVYIPVFNSLSDKDWDTVNAYSSWEDIEHILPPGTNDRYISYLVDNVRNTDNDYAYWKAKKGDICRYLSENGFGPGGNYRMPTSFEFGDKEDNATGGATGWELTGSSIYLQSDNEVGTTILPSYYSNSNAHVSFPRAGNINNNGTLSTVNRYGYHWSASGEDSEKVHCLREITRSSYHAAHAFPVRCVRN